MVKEIQTNWTEEVPVGITLCNTEGIILSMNDRAAKIFQQSAGKNLVGKNILECHPPKAKKKVLNLFDKKQTNAYTVEVNGIKSLLYQAPWYEEGKYMGFVEFIFVLPQEMAHLTGINWVK